MTEPTAEDFELFQKSRKKKPVKEKADLGPTLDDIAVRKALDRMRPSMALKTMYLDPRHCGPPPSLVTSRGFHVSHTTKIKHQLLKMGEHCNQKNFYVAVGNVSRFSLLFVCLLFMLRLHFFFEFLFFHATVHESCFCFFSVRKNWSRNGARIR